MFDPPVIITIVLLTHIIIDITYFPLYIHFICLIHIIYRLFDYILIHFTYLIHMIHIIVIIVPYIDIHAPGLHKHIPA